jgi:hypothetical protein
LANGENLEKTLFIFFISFFALPAPSLAQQWSPPTRIHAGGGFYPALYTSADTLIAAHPATQGGRAKIFSLHSVDAGEMWSSGSILNDTINYFGASLPDFIRYNNRVMILWYEYAPVGQLGNIAYSISSNSGHSWGASHHVFEGGLLDLDLFVAASVDSTVNIVYSRYIYPHFGFYVIRSTNFGRTWSSPVRLFWTEDNSYSEMEAWGDTFHFVWSGNFVEGVNWEVYYIKSPDRGLNWTAPETLTTPGDRGARHPALSINEEGKIALCWTDFRYAPPGWIADIFISKSTNQGESWYGESHLTFMHTDSYPDISYRGDTIDVVFERGNVTVRSIGHIRSTNNGATWGPESELDLDPADSYWPQVAVGNGKTYVIWGDARENPDTTINGGLYFSYFPFSPDAIGDESNKILPNKLSLSAYPNPFNSATTITLTSAEQAEIGIYDIMGRLITTLHANGGYALWDASAYSSGLYFARVAGEKPSAIKLILLR